MEAISMLNRYDDDILKSIMDELKRLSRAFTNHSEADRTDFTNLMNEVKTTQDKFNVLVTEIKVTQKLLGWVLSIAGCAGSAIVVDVVGHFAK